ncbi:suppressor of fused homolog [Rhagoletis pomonella]|uniref:suppressor of fused homolog n=1 Tax=Rhagoletis pomonella TaxID=28610 RepID=UPI0017811835|nr:suppressor of fused homolog [Rhagoletis pomonella]
MTETPKLLGQSSRMLPPPGLKALIDHFQSIYPDQVNPLQVTTVLKYWLGGQDPLDYISMYNNHGDPERGIPPHWHYVSFGLSDLHGDERVHVRDTNDINTRSGMGFELSFRLIKTESKSVKNAEKSQHPPTWPANLLQAIARYCFQTGNLLFFGDNIPWRKSLDGSATSLLKNILIAQDPQLSSIETLFGTVDFCQIVGVTDEEFDQASRWNGRGVLHYLQQDVHTGGKWLVTDMSRSVSVFQLCPELLLNLQDDLEKQGSDLAGVNADFTFREIQKQQCFEKEMDSNRLNEQYVFEENKVLNKLQIKRENVGFPQSMSMSNSSLHKSCPLNYQPHSANSVSFDGIEITLAPYAAKYLMLAIKDRIRHGRHFTFKAQHLALTLVAETVTGAIVSKSSPYGIIGYWIQVLIPKELVPRMMEAFQNLQLDMVAESKEKYELYWPEWKLKLTIDYPALILKPPTSV